MQLSDDPVVDEKTVELYKNSDYNEIKLAIQKAINIPDMEGKVMKVRNQDNALIPPTYMLDDQGSCHFIVDIAKINCSCKCNHNYAQKIRYLLCFRRPSHHYNSGCIFECHSQESQ